MATLSPRQMLAYNHLCDLWSPTITTQGNRKLPGPYELAEEGVPCHREIKRSADIATLLGRVESDIADSVDAWHFAEDQAIGDNWIIIDRSTNPQTGANGNLYGRAWMVRGEVQAFMRSERRQGGKKVILASREDRPPVGVG